MCKASNSRASTGLAGGGDSGGKGEPWWVMVRPLGQNIRIRGVAGSEFRKYGSRGGGMSLPQGTLQPRKHGLVETACGAPEQQRQVLQGKDGGKYETIGAEVVLLILDTSRGEICRIEVNDARKREMPGITTEDFLKALEIPSR